MAVGPDRVQVIKRESAALGGDAAEDADYYQPLAPQEDALECAGVYLQDATNRDETTYVARSGNNMVFRDVATGTEYTLTQLVGGAAATDPAWRRHFLLMGG